MFIKSLFPKVDPLQVHAFVVFLEEILPGSISLLVALIASKATVLGFLINVASDIHRTRIAIPTPIILVFVKMLITGGGQKPQNLTRVPSFAGYEEAGCFFVCKEYLKLLAQLFIVKGLEPFRLESMDPFTHAFNSSVPTIFVLLGLFWSRFFVSGLFVWLIFRA